MNKKIITLVAIAVIGSSLYFWWFSDSKVIHRNSEALLESFEKDSDSGRFGGAISSSKFRDLLADNVYFKFEQEAIPYASSFKNSINKDFLIQAHAGLVNSSGIVTITNKKVSINEISSNSANVSLSFHIKSEKLPQNFDHNLNFQLTYLKTDGEWKITSAIIK